MIAAARAVRRLHGEDMAVVFIGPCLAKKGEMNEAGFENDIDLVITFAELSEMFMASAEHVAHARPSDFDRPHAGAGALFPIRGGMLQAANIEEDLITAEVIAAEGNHEFPEAIREFESSGANVRLLELLACKGCIMGPGTTAKTPVFRRRARVSAYVRGRLGDVDRDQQSADYARCRGIQLDRGFGLDDQRLNPPDPCAVEEILYGLGKFRPEDELNCGACGYATCREHAIAISEGLAESEMCLPFMIERLGRTCNELSVANEQLASTQQALLHAEKLASMGQLAAGIAHEVNNPLSTVLMLSHLLLDETEESEEGNETREDLQMIVSEADRCRTIVSGLLQFARKNKVDAERVDAREIVDRALRGLNAPEPIQVNADLPDEPVSAEIDADQVLQVLTNVTTNAVHAMKDGGRLTVRLQADDDDLRILIADTGHGIPANLRKQIFEPFFTTKPAGQGTGLGLSVSYGIVKMHHGDITVDSNADPATGPTGTTFRIRLPRKRRAAPPSGEAD
jgi:two-component system NtrC family sensor kinase